MSDIPVNKRFVYKPIDKNPDLRRRIQDRLDRERHIPIVCSKEYPARGEEIYFKVRASIDGVDWKPIVREKSIYSEQKTIDDLLIVLCSFGYSDTRYEAAKLAIEMLRVMNPMPRVVLCEGTNDGNWHYDYVKEYDRFDYIPVDMTGEDYINFFCKESLWNHAANSVLEVNTSIKKLVFMDIDCFLVDESGWEQVDKQLDNYEVISPHRSSYYAGNSSSKYESTMDSIGYRVMRQMIGGYQGFSIGMTVEAYKNYFNSELLNPPLGAGDIFYWFMMVGDTYMKHFPCLPYREVECIPYIMKNKPMIGCGNQIMGHVDHGAIDTRIYKVRSQLTKMAVTVPLSETQRQEGYLVGWAHNREADDLRWSYERLMIENRREVKIATYEDTIQFYEWIHGRSMQPPKCILHTPFSKTGNKMPFEGVAIPVSDHYRIPF